MRRAAIGGRRLQAPILAFTLMLAVPGGALAASPAGGKLQPGPAEKGQVAWSGTVTTGDTTAATTDECFDERKRPRDPAISGCDMFKLKVKAPRGFYDGVLGGVQIDLTGFEPTDIDLGIYERKHNGKRGERVGGSGAFPGEPERALVPRARGAYYVVAVPYLVLVTQSYEGAAKLKVTKLDPSLDELNGKRRLRGLRNYRASHDRFLSHSEPTIAMDPLDHRHLIAGSKMYENLPRYLFKVGTYESFDGGRTWKDYGQLKGYCDTRASCNPDSDTYRVTSDPTSAFDDEGNAYINVLDAPGGASGPPGWNMQVHIKRPGKRWTGPITVHDNRRDPVSHALLLDDKNWIAVDNSTTVDGRPNRPDDGEVGTIYICWSLDFDAVGQQIVLMRSTDGGKTWGGFVPGDNLPYQVSQRGVVSGIGCHIAIGPQGEVYVTWYDSLLDQLAQAKSIDRGRTFTLARPIASITGVSDPFEGQAFRNLSIPTTAVDRRGNLYVAVMVDNDEDPEKIDADIALFKSTDGGLTYSEPVRVNQDKGRRDQFQPWMAVTRKGQINIAYFDRRKDPNNYFIQTWLSRSNNGGKTWTDVPVGQRFWDPGVKPPISPSGEFIGDYQGLVADDRVAIPFWNDTQASTLSKRRRNYSPHQEVWAARVPNTPKFGGPRD